MHKSLYISLGFSNIAMMGMFCLLRCSIGLQGGIGKIVSSKVSILRLRKLCFKTSSTPRLDGITDEMMLPLEKDDAQQQFSKRVTTRETDFSQKRDLDDILIERAVRFQDPTVVGSKTREACIIVAVDVDRPTTEQEFTLKESLQELSELVGTAGLEVVGSCIQKLNAPNPKTYIGSGKVDDIIQLIQTLNAKTLVFDDDLTPKQQRNLESAISAYNITGIKVLDRTAVILDIFAQHAKSREGQLQVELAMLEYRMTRGPRASGAEGADTGAGFRGPGESKVELDKRMIKEKIVLIQKEIASRGTQRELHRQNRFVCLFVCFHHRFIANYIVYVRMYKSLLRPGKPLIYVIFIHCLIFVH